MFRIKRALFVDNTTGLLPDIYHEVRLVLVSNGLPDIVNYGQGILKEIYLNVDNTALSNSDKSILKNRIIQEAANVLAANNISREMEYWNEADRVNVTWITHTALDAAEFAWRLAKDQNYISTITGNSYSGTVPLNSINKLEQHINWLDNEMKNIQFLSDADLNNQVNIDHYRSNAHPLGEGEVLTVLPQKIKENIYESNLAVGLVDVSLTSDQKINLVPGRYDVNLIFRDNNGVFIPASGLITDDINYTPAMLGGAELTEDNRVWRFTANELDSSSKIKLYFFRFDDPGVADDISETGNIGEYSKRYRSYIEPEYLP